MMSRTPEEKKALFVKLAVKRTNTLLHQIRLIANLSNTSNYEYTEEQYRKIFIALRRRLDKCEMEFDAPKKITSFSLD